MKLDRNVNGTGRGKYGLVYNRRLKEIIGPIGDSRNAANMDEVNAMKVREAIKLLEEEGVITWGLPNTESEFFVIKLRDRFAHVALVAYAQVAHWIDAEYAKDVRELADRAGPYSKFYKAPD